MTIEKYGFGNGKTCERLVAKVYTREAEKENGFIYNFSKGEDLRIITMRACKTYCEVSIYMNTREECEKELEGQLSDGIFENIPFSGYKIIE